MIEGIKREWVDQYWPVVSPWIEKALIRGGAALSLDEVRERIDDRRMQLWVAWAEMKPSLAVVTEIYETAAGLTCSITATGGSELSACLPDLAVIEGWARDQGCVRMALDGREGWVRVMKSRGYAVATVQLEKTLGQVKDDQHDRSEHQPAA